MTTRAPLGTLAVFNDPRSADSREAVLGAMRDLIRLAGPGGLVRLATYKLYDSWVVEELISARARGALVEIAVAEHNEDIRKRSLVENFTNTRKQTANIEALTGAQVRVHVVPSRLSIRGEGSQTAGVLHSKFAVVKHNECFSAMITSANINDSMTRSYNDALVFLNNREIYQDLVSHWIRLCKRQVGGSRCQRAGREERVVTFPRQRDYISELILTLGEGDELRIAMSYWTLRRVEVNAAILSFLSKGGTVRALVSWPTYTEGALCQWLARRTEVRSLEKMHSKFIHISSKKGTALIAGSHNFTRASLEEHDELLIHTRDSEVAAAYLKRWNELWECGEAIRLAGA